jgi:hypothetical protein
MNMQASRFGMYAEFDMTDTNSRYKDTRIKGHKGILGGCVGGMA